MIIKLLAEDENLYSAVVTHYIVTCLEKGRVVSEVISDLKQDVNFTPHVSILQYGRG